MTLCTERLGEDPEVSRFRHASQSLLSLSKPERELFSLGSLTSCSCNTLGKGTVQNVHDGWQAAGNEMLAFFYKYAIKMP